MKVLEAADKAAQMPQLGG